MITQTVTVSEKNNQNIIIGRRDTYGTEEIAFDLSYLIDAFGDGTAVLLIKRPQDATAYPASGITQTDSTLTWRVSGIDTAYKGHGECEIYWYVDDGLAKSIIYSVTILRDIGETREDPPDAYETWIDTLTALGAETLANAQAAAESAANAETSERNAADSEAAAKQSEDNAEDSAESAEADALKAEGFAVGEQDGTAVTTGSPYYQNNAKYYANVAQQGAEEAGYAWFDVNDQDGQMYVTITPNLAEDVSFSVNENLGVLEVTYYE